MAVELANVGVYGTLWLVQIVLCGRVLFGDRTGDDVLFRERAGGDVVVVAGSAEVAGGAARGQLEGFDPLGHHVHHGAGSLHPAPDHHGTS